ncbi:tetratricopeptide repeat protein [Streptomyces sp. NPDC005794]|uniref:tetratricopeptide repeat protein n=1 Tax=Streptomyces sp. NPDC005794 TaxID=3364733 RepID=UPI0036CE8D60
MDEHTARPFDAAEALIRESATSTPAEWSTVSLAKFIKDVAITPPSERGEGKSEAQALAAISALTSRGLDGHAFVRYGVGSELANRISALSSLGPLLQHLSDHTSRELGLPAELKVELTEISDWSALCERMLGEESSNLSTDSALLEGIMKITHDWRRRVQSWVFSASITDILAWECSAGTEVGDLFEINKKSDTDLTESLAWISDRLTVTYLSDWELKSLHREFRWLRGDIPTPCPESVMAIRSLNPADLHLEIASRAVFESENEALSGTVDQLRIQAVQTLKSGDRSSAIALFRVIVRIAPSDVSAKNNLGFALIQDSPREALRHLNGAAKAGCDQPLINLHNRMLCHQLLGENRQALLVAEQTWLNGFPGKPVPALLWASVPGGDDWILEDHRDAREAVAQLAHTIAESVGLEASGTWRGRASEIAGEAAL